MKKYLCSVFLLMLMFVGCRSAAYEKTDDGIVVHLNAGDALQTAQVRLQVVADDIIRVSATPAKQFSERKSLITVYEPSSSIHWTVSENDDCVVLTTATLKASVSRATGAVVFADLDGNILLEENAGGGKSYSPIEVEGKKAYSVRQVFESPDDEAFYGLGQHQSDEFNYKGRNEVLYQYNTKVSVPFVVSTKNYGLLWDNYSLTKWGDPRDYANIDQFKLYDKQGKEGGLTASYSYLGDADHRLVFVERTESQIDYENLETVKNFPLDFPFGNSQITWEGELEAPETGLYHFILCYASSATVYLDHQVIVSERWRANWNANSYKFTVDMKAGEKRAVKLVWKTYANSYIGLKALSPVAREEQNRLSLWSEMADEIDYYFIRGNNPDGVISGYRTLTGKAPVMPKWAMGFWQSRERYKTQAELLQALDDYRSRNIPLDNIVQDWFYWSDDNRNWPADNRGWGSHDFDPDRFPDPKGMVDSVHARNARIMISVWPRFYYKTDHYKEFDKQGWMYNRAVKDSVCPWIKNSIIAGFYDAYSKGARQLFWQQINEKLYSKGIDAWWLDASEPDILAGAGMQYRKALSTPTALGSSTEYFNTYALMNAQAIYEGQRSVNPGERVFMLTRSGFAGLQRYSAATWSGDIGARWEEMKAQISAGINYALSGIPYWTTDIGGFNVENCYVGAPEGSADLAEWRELNTRWFQFGAFCPLFRSHGTAIFPEIYNLAPATHPAYKSMVYYDKLRYRLMPYIYSLAGKTYFDDYTIMRGLVMDFGNDAATHSIGDQFMFGASLMVCPVYTYKATSRQVYFPQGTWYDFETNKPIAGGQTLLVDAPYERIPLFVKAGAIIPTGKVIQHTKEVQKDLTITVYTGADGTFTLYEDEGTNYNYAQGAYSTISFAYNDATQTLTIGARQGEYAGMDKERVFTIQWVGCNKPAVRVVYTGESYELNE